MHFTRWRVYEHTNPADPRGGSDSRARQRYLDGLSRFLRQRGARSSGARRGRGAPRQGLFYTTELPHPVSVDLAAPVANLAPVTQPRLFTPVAPSGLVGLESVAPVPQAQRLAGQYKIISRETAYHGTTFGALSITGITPLRTPFEPLVPGAYHAPNTNDYRWAEDRDTLWAADQIEHVIEFQDPDTVAAVILEPVQNSGGCFVPQDGYWQRVREICDRHNVLLIADEVICSWGRLGHWFGVERFGVVPDLITTAKGITSAYAPMGAVIVSMGRRPVHGGLGLLTTAYVRRPPGCPPRWRWRTSTSSSARTSAPGAREGARVSARCSSSQGGPADRRRRPRGQHFHALEWSKTRRPRELHATESETAARLHGCELYKRGLI